MPCRNPLTQVLFFACPGVGAIKENVGKVGCGGIEKGGEMIIC